LRYFLVCIAVEDLGAVHGEAEPGTRPALHSTLRKSQTLPAARIAMFFLYKLLYRVILKIDILVK